MFPIVRNYHMAKANKDSHCALCNNKMPPENYWMCFGGGFSIDRHFHDGSGATLNIVDNEPGKQADIGFCSKECAKSFIIKIADNIK